jgi:hypothetical protein
MCPVKVSYLVQIFIKKNQKKGQKPLKNELLRLVENYPQN